jgi:hypothetical protein
MSMQQQKNGARQGSLGAGVRMVQGARTDAGSTAPKIATPSSPATSVEAAAAELETILHELIVEHEQLLTLAAAHKKALREASATSLGPIVESQNMIVQRVAELEKRRLALVASLGERLGLGKTGSADRPSLAWLATGLPANVGERLARIGARLRELLKKLQQEHAALRDAAATLATHMEAVMRQVAGRLSHAGVYGRTGTVETRVQVMSALDLRS